MVGAAVIGVTWVRYGKALSSPAPQPTVAVSRWGSSIGSVSPNSRAFDKQKLSFWAIVDNNTNHTVYVTNVKVNLPGSLQSHVLTGNTLIVVEQALAPNATYKIKGDLILATIGMTKQEILKRGNIKGFTVATKS